MALNTADKAQLRREMRRQRAALSETQRARINAGITRQLLSHPSFQASQTIFVYWSTPDEIDTHAIIDAALQTGKRVCVPKCLPGHVMQPRCIRSQADLTEESFGIPEPGSQCPAVPPEEIELCIIPALACDASGARLGYGGGFYDRFLPQTSAYRIVLCAHNRVLEQVPTEPHDIRCHCILTEQEVMHVHER